MKRRLFAMLLALVLVMSLLPMSAFAEETSGTTPCPANGHTADMNTGKKADWSTDNGGYVYDYYDCSKCGERCNANGFDSVYVGCITDKASGGAGVFEGHALYPQVYDADYAACAGGYRESYRKCHCGETVFSADGTKQLTREEGSHTVGAAYTGNDTYAEAAYYCAGNCGAIVNAGGVVLEATTPGGGNTDPGECTHEADLNRYELANYHPCTGGIKEVFWSCDCGQIFGDAEGKTPAISVGPETNGKHTPSGDVIKADYSKCQGGFEEDRYYCAACGRFTNADGDLVERQSGSGHTPGADAYEPDWTACGGGCKEVWYECVDCGAAVNAEGEVIRVAGEEPHQLGELNPGNVACEGGYMEPWGQCSVCNGVYNEMGMPLEQEAAVPHKAGQPFEEYMDTTCGGGYEGEVFYCKHGCGQILNAEGTPVQRSETNHTPDLNSPKDPNYTACGGGITGIWYPCMVCGSPADVDGNNAPEREPTAEHNISPDLMPPTYTECMGGIKTPHYVCTVCGWEFDDVNGEAGSNWEPGVENPTHVPDLNNKIEVEKNPCGSGIAEDYYFCKYCGMEVFEDGSEAVSSEGKHTPGTKLYMSNYSACGGGHKEDFYVCTLCWAPCNADGGAMEWFPSTTEVHSPGTKVYPANFTGCAGGITEDYYLCLLCGVFVDAEGNVLFYESPTKAHAPDLNNKQKATYTECGGGIKVDFYICTVCEWPVDEKGIDVNEFWAEPAEGAKHKIIPVAAKEATVDEEGWDAHYMCEACEWLFLDAAGEKETDGYELLRPKKAAVNTYELPAQVTVGAQTVTKTELEESMKDAAISEGLDKDKATSVSMDITLQVKNDKGEWESVSQEYFTEGNTLEVVIPFPTGTSKTGFQFVVSHMITQGPNAGRVETFTLGKDENIWVSDDGIHVIFSSLSPVMVTYQEKAAAPAEPTPTPAPTPTPTPTPAPTTKPGSSIVPNTGDDANPVLWMGMLAVSAAMLVLLAKKRRA